MRNNRRRQNLQFFSCGFILSITFVLLVLGLLYVNHHAQQTGWVDDKTLVEAYNSADTYTLRIVNLECTLDWKAYRKIRPTLEKLTVFVPASIRALAASLHGIADVLPQAGDADIPDGPPS